MDNTTNDLKHIMRTLYPEMIDTHAPLLSDKSQIMIDRILSQIQDSKHVFANTSSIEIQRVEKIPTDSNFSHIHPKIKETIDKDLSKYLYCAHFTMPGSNDENNHKKITVYMAFHTNPRKHVLKSHIQFMYRWLWIADHYANPGCSPELTIYMYLTHLKKEMENIYENHENHAENGKTNKVLDEYNVNTAFTQSCRPNTNYIYIYREEEWRKTFIHETFHSLGLDFIQIYSPEIDTHLKRVFGLHIDYSLYEAYSEFWAELIHILFYCAEPDSKNRTSIYKKIEKELRYQRTFSLIQAAKVLEYNGLTYDNLIHRSSSAGNDRLSKYREETPLFAYHIIKTIMMFYMADFIEWCMDNNRGSLQFTLKKWNVIGFIHLIADHFKREDMRREMKIISAKNKRLNLSPPFSRTLRMTPL
jgi:hypothetical protein